MPEGRASVEAPPKSMSALKPEVDPLRAALKPPSPLTALPLSAKHALHSTIKAAGHRVGDAEQPRVLGGQWTTRVERKSE